MYIFRGTLDCKRSGYQPSDKIKKRILAGFGKRFSLAASSETISRVLAGFGNRFSLAALEYNLII